jgi:hypothetical protein
LTKKRDRWGRKDQTARLEADRVTVPAPDLRIVSDALWMAARDRLTRIKARLLTSSHGRIGRRTREVESVLVELAPDPLT